MKIVKCRSCGKSVQDHHKRCPVCDKPLKDTPGVSAAAIITGLILTALVCAVTLFFIKSNVNHRPDTSKVGRSVASVPKTAVPRRAKAPLPEKRKFEWDFWNKKKREEERKMALRRSAMTILEKVFAHFSTARESDHIRHLMEAVKERQPAAGRALEVNQLIIFSQDGLIHSSLNPADVGKKVSETHYDVYLDSPAQGALSMRDSREEFCMVRPVRNREGCFDCHSREKRILGILDVCVVPVSSRK